MKKLQIALVVVLALAVATAASAQMTPRTVGMGGAVVGLADDSAAWATNPAGLPNIKLTAEAGGSWDGLANLSWGTVRHSSTDIFSLTASLKRTPESNWGIGIGYADIEDTVSTLGVGYGYQFKNSPLSIGASILRVDPDIPGVSSETVFDLGFMYSFAMRDRAPLKAGLVIRDLTEEISSDRTFDLGFSWQFSPQWLLAFDIVDFTDEMVVGPFFNIGAEYSFANASPWKARAGFADDGSRHNLSLGAGYDLGKWSVDAAFVNLKGGDFWTIGGTIGF